MKRYFFSVVAVLMAIGFSAFSTVKNHPSKLVDTYFWYDLSGHALNGGTKIAEPSTNCTSAGTNCAKGFSSVPSDPINDPPQQTRAHN